MSRKAVVVLLVGALLAAVALPVSAHRADTPRDRNGYGYGCGGMGVGGFMWDEDGALLDRDAFEDRLDRAIEDGYILAEDRDECLDMYDDCVDNRARNDGRNNGYDGARHGGRGGCHSDGRMR